SIAMTRSFSPVAASGFLAPSALGSEREFSLASADAVSKAIALASGSASSRPLTSLGASDEYERFAASGLARPARAKRVLFPRRDDERRSVTLEPAYYVEVALASGPARSAVVSAIDGRILFQNDLVRNDAYTYR